MQVNWNRNYCQNLYWNELFLWMITAFALIIILENVKKHTLNPDLEKFSTVVILGNIFTNTKNQIISNKKNFPILCQRI